MSLKEKIELAYAFLRGNEVLHGGKGYYLAFSGGKDSIVCKQLCIEAGVKFDAHYNNVTIDPPELIYYIKKHHPEVHWNQPKKNLIMSMEEECQGPPTRLARWCCEIYKEQGGIGRARIIGVRAAESPRRAAQWKQITP